jgi:hypothetical protein
MPGCTVAPPSSSHPVAAFASPPLLPACHAITASPPPRGPWSACIRAVPSTAFSSTTSDILHARPRCSRADPPAAAALQILPHRAWPPYTPSSFTPSPCTPSPCTPAQLLLLFLLLEPRAVPQPLMRCSAPPPLAWGKEALVVAGPEPRAAASPAHASSAPPAPLQHACRLHRAPLQRPLAHASTARLRQHCASRGSTRTEPRGGEKGAAEVEIRVETRERDAREKKNRERGKTEEKEKRDFPRTCA